MSGAVIGRRRPARRSNEEHLLGLLTDEWVANAEVARLAGLGASSVYHTLAASRRAAGKLEQVVAANGRRATTRFWRRRPGATGGL